MIRLIIRVFQAKEAGQPQRPRWEYPWWDVMNIIRRVQLSNTYWLESIGLLIGFATMFAAVAHRLLTPGHSRSQTAPIELVRDDAYPKLAS